MCHTAPAYAHTLTPPLDAIDSFNTYIEILQNKPWIFKLATLSRRQAPARSARPR